MRAVRGERRRSLLAAAAVLIIALALRAHDITTNPPGLVDDEVAGAIAAWTIVTTGQDLDRTWLPFLVVERESMKQPIYGFATVPTQALFGHTPLGVRLPAVLFGTLSTALVIILARVLGRSRTEAIVAGALFAVMPWAVHYGRIGWETAAFLPFTLGGLALLWAGLERHRRGSLMAGTLVLAIGSYTYQAALFINVLLGAFAVVAHLRTLRRSDVLAVGAAAAIGLVALLPYLRAVMTEPLMTERLTRISVFRDGVNGAAAVHAWTNLLAQWDLEWLFIHGHWNLHYGPGMPLLPAVIAALVPMGLIALLLKRDRVAALLLFWLVIGQLPGALTDFPPNWSRGLAVVPALAIVSGAAVVAWWGWARGLGRVRSAIAVATIAITLIQLQGLYHSYFAEYPRRADDFFRNGIEDTIRAAAIYARPGDTVCAGTPDSDSWGFEHRVRFALDGPPKFRLVTDPDAVDCDYSIDAVDQPTAGGEVIFTASDRARYVLVRLD